MNVSTCTRSTVALLVGLALALTGAVTAHAQGFTLNDLIEKGKALDGQEVTVRGEVIGDVMIRGESGWVNINDGSAALGVWAPAEQLRAIVWAGRYGVRGDTLEVTGTFYRMDAQNGGELDIEARQVTVVSSGGPKPEPPPAGRITWLLVFTLTAVLTGGLFWRRRRQRPAEARQI